MSAIPLYPGYRPPKGAATPSRLIPAAEVETPADRHATRQGEILRRNRARAITLLVRERTQWAGIERSRRAEAMRILKEEGEVPDWLSAAVRAAQAEIRRVNRKLDPRRAEAWVHYEDAFIEEAREVAC